MQPAWSSCTGWIYQDMQACRQVLLAMEEPHDLAMQSGDQHSQHSKQHAWTRPLGTKPSPVSST